MATKLSHVGIETELDVVSRDSFLSSKGLNVGDVVDGVAEVDSEYYENQVEFKSVGKLAITDFENFRNVVTEMLASGEAHKPYSRSPAFVGTHIHMFFNENGRPMERFPNKGKTFLVMKLYAEVLTFFKEWIEMMPEHEGKLKFGRFVNPFKEAPLKRELERVLTSNNVSKYFDVSVMRGALKKVLKENGMAYVYNNIGDDRPKYQPLIWSLTREDGKPLSLEARLLPNAWFLLSKKETVVRFVEDMCGSMQLWKSFDSQRHDLIERASRKAVLEMVRSMAIVYKTLFINIGHVPKNRLLNWMEEALQLVETVKSMAAQERLETATTLAGTPFELIFSDGPVGGSGHSEGGSGHSGVLPYVTLVSVEGDNHLVSTDLTDDDNQFENDDDDDDGDDNESDTVDNGDQGNGNSHDTVEGALVDRVTGDIITRNARTVHAPDPRYVTPNSVSIGNARATGRTGLTYAAIYEELNRMHPEAPGDLPLTASTGVSDVQNGPRVPRPLTQSQRTRLEDSEDEAPF